MSSFRAFRLLSRGIVNRIELPDIDALCLSRAKHILTGIESDPPALFNGDPIWEYGKDTTARGGSVITQGIPSKPPFDSVWFEYTDTGNVPIALYIRRAELGRDSWTCSTIVLPPSAIGVVVAPYDLSISFGDDGVLTDAIYTDTDPGVPDHIRQSDVLLNWHEHSLMALKTAITAFMFAHCRNVDLVTRLPKRHEQREAKRRGEPILKYHEIVIDPNRSYATTETSRNASTAPSKSLHLVRGHFAHYTEEKPLFGKYSGTFWVPAHVRGSAEVGEVKSTYRVEAGEP